MTNTVALPARGPRLGGQEPRSELTASSPGGHRQSIEDCYNLVLSQHCHCHLLLASGKKPPQRPAGKRLRTEKRVYGQERTCLSGQHAWQELHVCGHALRMRKCPYKRAAHAPRHPLALLLAASLLGSALAGASTPAQRLSRLDIAGHRRIRGGGN